MRTKNIYYYTLLDIYRPYKISSHEVKVLAKPFDLYDYSSVDYYYGFLGALLSAGAFTYSSTAVASLSPILESTEVKELFKNYLLVQCAKSFIVESDENVDLDVVGTDEYIEDRATQIAGWLISSYPIYKQLTSYYTTELTHLLDDIVTTSSSTQGSTDAPITSTFGTPSSVDSLTMLLQNSGTVSEEGGTKMQRLKEIRDSLDSIYQKWAREFQKTFIIYPVIEESEEC